MSMSIHFRDDGTAPTVLDEDQFISTAIMQWLAVAHLMSRKIAHAQTTNAILPHEVETWRRVRHNALTEAAKLLQSPA